MTELQDRERPKVSLIDAPEYPERVVCLAARGDQMDGSLYGMQPYKTDDYLDVMEPVDGSDVELDDTYDPPNGTAKKKTKAFIERLLRKGHMGPFEHPQLTFGIEGVSRVCMAQLTRHRHATFDAQSMREVDFSEVDPIVPESMENSDDFDVALAKSLFQITPEYYKDLVESGIPKEDARFVLPLAMPVNMTASFNARSLMHLGDMRLGADAQAEIRLLTERMLDTAAEVMPYTIELYRKHVAKKHRGGP